MPGMGLRVGWSRVVWGYMGGVELCGVGLYGWGGVELGVEWGGVELCGVGLYVGWSCMAWGYIGGVELHGVG